MDDGSIFMIVALIILIGLSAFFSAAETAYNSLNEIRLRSKAEDGDAKAAHTLALVERYDSLLSTILIGNNIVNIGASSLREKDLEYQAREQNLEKLEAKEDARTAQLEEYRVYVQTKQYVEKVAKEKLGLVKKDEILFKAEESR